MSEMPAKAVILGATLLALVLPAAGSARADSQGLAPAGADAVRESEPPDPEAIVDEAKANGFSINRMRSTRYDASVRLRSGASSSASRGRRRLRRRARRNL